ncbi:hypothetical protein [Nostoc sp. PA-18-2419]|uniref:hypothetical protein n=1 Tax=Nostoc sp. PA-18-2419 TaxID=2575443 RepID=UPI00110876DE|nr:hypothetical protein [Nostoc sp. PA-18-2419]
MFLDNWAWGKQGVWEDGEQGENGKKSFPPTLPYLPTLPQSPVPSSESLFALRRTSDVLDKPQSIYNLSRLVVSSGIR